MLSTKNNEYQKREFMPVIYRSLTLSLFGFALYAGINSLAWGQTALIGNPITTKLNVDSNISGKFRPQAEIDSLQNIKFVKLILVPPFINGVAPLTEHDLRERGCMYVAQNSTDSMEIVNILKDANIKIDPRSKRGWLLKEGVFITLEDGSEFKFLFDFAHASERIVPGTFNEHPVIANGTLPESLYRWAVKMKISPRCGDFIDPYKTK